MVPYHTRGSFDPERSDASFLFSLFFDTPHLSEQNPWRAPSFHITSNIPRTMPSKSSLLVISPLDTSALQVDEDGKPVVSEAEHRLDSMDPFNHPRLRRALILQQLLKNHQEDGLEMEFHQVKGENDWTKVYEKVHTKGLLEFLSTAWDRWNALGTEGQDPSGGRDSTSGFVLVPSCMPLPRDPWQRPSQHVIGQMGYYVTDDVTPVYGALVKELQVDAAAVKSAVEAAAQTHSAVYVLTTHPGHHGAADSFGGYCYVNNVAAAARQLQATLGDEARVAILDVDYHAGNGTASIFYEDPSVLVVSLHCDPNHDYPFHHGFADQTGHGEGQGTTLHLPMPPGTTWEASYQEHLQTGLSAIQQFTPRAVLVSLGLDTHDQDPCAIRRAGFGLKGKDYKAMGRLLADELPAGMPVVFFQEGGYRMDKIGEAAANVVTSFCQHRSVA
eukprot:scaffold1294_cov167-Amphora_coffeaeformis.AAC.30